MSAACDCGWTGTPSQVRDGGRCPECMSKVLYRSAPVGIAVDQIRTVQDFNRRAVKALGVVTFGHGNTQGVVDSFRRQVEMECVSEKMQQAIYNIVNRYRAQITEKALLDYAADRAKGHDQ